MNAELHVIGSRRNTHLRKKHESNSPPILSFRDIKHIRPQIIYWGTLKFWMQNYMSLGVGGILISGKKHEFPPDFVFWGHNAYSSPNKLLGDFEFLNANLHVIGSRGTGNTHFPPILSFGDIKHIRPLIYYWGTLNFWMQIYMSLGVGEYSFKEKTMNSNPPPPPPRFCLLGT